MFKADYHIHSEYSSDSTQSLEQIFDRAVELGLDGVAVTDHLDVDFPREDDTFKLDLPEYLKVMSGYRERGWKGLQVRVGIELGLQPHAEEDIKAIMARPELDFVIGSQHCVDRTEFFDDSFFQGKEKDEAHRKYFEEFYRNLKLFDDVSVLGHMDFFRRYGRPTYGDSHSEVNYKAHMDVIDDILRLAVDRGVGIELNTSAHRLGLGHFHPHSVILKRYHELGGEIITVGSDGHTPSDIALEFDRCYDLLQSLGFRYVCGFTGRKPKFYALAA